MILAMPATAPTTATWRALLGSLIDHAALFPPASMAPPDALAADRGARDGEHAWMLARFVCPASRLHELALAAGGSTALPPLSVVLDGDAGDALRLTVAAVAAGARVELVEVAASDPGDLRAEVDRALGAHVRLHVEGADPASLRERVAAKVRCGGATPAATPSPEALAAFVAACAGAGVPFKATAGLHHPVRTAGMHGFLNLLAAACLAHAGGGEDALAAVLALDDPGAVLETLAGVRPEGVGATRAGLFHSIGSCSFAEPVDDLRALDVLP